MKSVLHIALIAPGGYSNTGIMNGFLASGFSSYNLFDFQLHIYNNDKETMRRMLIQEAEKVKPDLIFCQIQSSEILDLPTWHTLSQMAFTVNYTFDIRTKEQTQWLYNIAPVLGLLCFSNQRDVYECGLRGHGNSMVLQSSVDMDVYKTGYKERSGIVFIGNNFKNTNHQFPLSDDRVEMVSFLKEQFQNKFHVYGSNWGGSKITTQKEEIEIYQSALIAISHNNFDEELYTSDRIWRIMATGSLCLTKYFKGIDRIFNRDLHLDWWESLEELRYKASYYLSHPERAMEKAANGMEFVRGNHNWTCRIAEMMQHVKRLKPENKSEACMKAGAHVIDGVIPEPFHEQFDGRTCDCGKLLWKWTECGCQDKTFQLRAQENI